MTSLFLLGFLSNFIELFGAESIFISLPNIEDIFLTVKGPSNYDLANDLFDKLKIEERAELCKEALENQLYIYNIKEHNYAYRTFDYNFYENYQEVSANDESIPKERNIVHNDKYGVQINWNVMYPAFKRFLCSSKNEGAVRRQELFICSGLRKGTAFVLIRSDERIPLRIRGLLIRINVINIEATGTNQLINDLINSSKQVCALGSRKKFDLCSIIHRSFALLKLPLPSKLEETRTQKVFLWYDLDEESCQNRKITNVDATPNDELQSAQTLACVFGKQRDVKDASIFVSLKDVGKDFTTAAVMVPIGERYDEANSPLKVLTSVQFKFS